MAKSKTLSKAENDANLAAIKAAREKAPTTPAVATIGGTGTVKCKSCNREFTDGRPTCECGAVFECQS